MLHLLHFPIIISIVTIIVVSIIPNLIYLILILLPALSLRLCFGSFLNHNISPVTKLTSNLESQTQ